MSNHDKLKSQFKIPVTLRDQKHFDFGPEDFRLVHETTQDGERICQQQAAKEQAEDELLARTPVFAALSQEEEDGIARCGCSKFTLCKEALSLAKAAKAGHIDAAAAYSKHRQNALREIAGMATA